MCQRHTRRLEQMGHLAFSSRSPSAKFKTDEDANDYVQVCLILAFFMKPQLGQLEDGQARRHGQRAEAEMP